MDMQGLPAAMEGCWPGPGRVSKPLCTGWMCQRRHAQLPSVPTFLHSEDCSKTNKDGWALTTPRGP